MLSRGNTSGNWYRCVRLDRLLARRGGLAQSCFQRRSGSSARLPVSLSALLLGSDPTGGSSVIVSSRRLESNLVRTTETTQDEHSADHDPMPKSQLRLAARSVQPCEQGRDLVSKLPE